jgi:hypothetical protein
MPINRNQPHPSLPRYARYAAEAKQIDEGIQYIQIS